jgi:hypothetical protein
MIERGNPNAADGAGRVSVKVLVAATAVKALYWVRQRGEGTSAQSKRTAWDSRCGRFYYLAAEKESRRFPLAVCSKLIMPMYPKPKKKSSKNGIVPHMCKRAAYMIAKKK